MVGMRRAVAGAISAVVVLGGAVLALASGPGAAAAVGDQVVFSDGFESGGLSAWTGGSGLAVQQAIVAAGSWAARATLSGSAAYAYKTLPTTQPDLTVSLSLNPQNVPSGSSVNFLKVRTATGSAIAEVFVNSTGVLGIRNDVLGASTNSPVSVSTGSWHAVSLHVVVAGTSSRAQIDLDGTRVLDLTTNLGTTPVGRVQLGENLTGRTADQAYDSLVVTVPGTTPPPPPTGVFSDGFESGDLSAWSGGSGLVVQQDVVSDGVWAARATMTGGAAYAYRDLPTGLTDATVSTRVNLQSVSGTAAVNFLKARTATGTALAEVYVTTAGVLGVRDDVAGAATNSTATISPGAWHTVTLRVVTGTNGTLRVTLDGATVLDLAASLGTATVGRVQLGENVTGRTADLAYDTVVVDGSSTPISTDPVLLAAGDIACDPLSSAYNGGNGTSNACRQKAISDLVLTQTGVSAVAALGDVQYYCGGYKAFLAAYDPTWGRFKGITHPAVGNHEYLTSGTSATDCDPTGTAAGYFTYFGAAAGQKGQGWYSYDLGAWHVVVLNTNCSDAGGCGTGSPQEVWLRNDLAAHPTQCTMAYWHIPLWSSGGRAASNSKTFVKDLVAAGADVVLTGHDHTYERFAPMDSTGALSATGVREFVVGTGGANHTTFTTIAANSEVRDSSTFGVLRLTLHPGSYDWQFLAEAGKTFTDSGTATCH
jgi:hypothetical protein